MILPGSKATIADLDALRSEGWDIDLKAHLRRGGRVLGLCGGYQMLGRTIGDPDGIEGPPARSTGSACWTSNTVLEGDKVLVEASGETWTAPCRSRDTRCMSAAPTGALRPLLRLGNGKVDGAVSADGRVAGCYIHGLLADDRQRQHWLRLIGGQAAGFDYEADVDTTLDLLADHLEKHVDCDLLLELARAPKVRA